jgi:Zinc knuckle
MTSSRGDDVSNAYTKVQPFAATNTLKRKDESQAYTMRGLKINKRNRRMFGYMIKGPQHQTEAQSSLENQMGESNQAQLPTQALQQPSPVEDPTTLTRKEVKARKACYYCKEDGHFIRQCPKKKLHRQERKALKQPPVGINGEVRPKIAVIREYDEYGTLKTIRCEELKK